MRLLKLPLASRPVLPPPSLLAVPGSQQQPWRQWSCRPCVCLPRRWHRAAAAGSSEQQASSSASAGIESGPSAADDKSVPQPLPAGQPRTRLQEEEEQLLAIDVEYAHFRVPGQRRIAHLAAEVCVVDSQRRTVLHTHCNPLGPEQADWRFIGGVRPAQWEAAPPLAAVQAQLAVLIAGRVLVGHNLPKDLATLGVEHPKSLQRDTMKYRQLQSGKKQGQRLQALSEEKLGRKIQTSERHDPREDALAALDLYLSHVHFDTATMGYQDLVEHHLAEILAAAAVAAAAAEGEGREEGAGDSDGSEGGGRE